MSPAPKSRDWTLPTLIAVATLCAMLVNGATGALRAMGMHTISPDARLAQMEAYDANRKVTVDSMFRASARRLDSLSERVGRMNELQLRMAAVSCLTPSEAYRLTQAQMPCGRIIRELEIKP